MAQGWCRVSATQDFTHFAETTAPIERVAELIADSDNWYRWTRPYVAQSRCERWGSGLVHGVGSIRRVGLAPVWIREMVTDWDPRSHQTYTILSPRLFNRYRGIIQFSESVDGSTRIAWSVDFEPRVRPAGPLLRAGMSAVIRVLVNQLAQAGDRVAEPKKWEVRR